MKMSLDLMVFILEINLDEYPDIGTHWIALYVKNNEVIYFNSFGIEHVPKEIKRFIGHKKDIKKSSSIQLNNVWTLLCLIH